MRTVRDVVGGARHQDLARQRETHEARRDRLDEAFDLGLLGAAADVVGAVVPDDDVTDVDADARGEFGLLLRAEFAEFALVIECVGDRLDRPLEHEQETVGLVDLAATVLLHERARETIVLADEVGRPLVTEAFDECGRIDEVAEDERAQHRRRAAGHAVDPR
ncbi:hypothetical protein FHW12_001588 [Dokdonella fugitiva]|uniref:Uncharacterized protein n=1 Tax=Dokdonella fugitiva TaxID=328517 RepID=A0A839F535_9GAMM|nr:hypothetical protein [Dokdonella fugitiva]